MTREEIRDLFMEGIDCSQVVVGEFDEKTGMDRETLRKMAACFGGLVYGHSREGDQAQKDRMLEKVSEFKRLFGEKYPSCMCRELLGHDISKEGEMEKVMEKGLLFELCPRIVEDTICILEKVL